MTPTSPQFGWKKTLLFSLAPLVVLLGVAEGLCRIIEVWIPPMQVDYGQGFDEDSRLFVPDSTDADRMITNPAKETSFREQSFVMPKPAGTMRIFALGGSSVNYLDYEFPLLAERLQKELSDRFQRVEIINCGGLSYGSHRLVPVAAEVMSYEPDLVLIYSGHNEFEELEQLELADLNTLRLQRALANSALWRFLRDRMAQRHIRRLEDEKNARILAESATELAPRNWLHEFTPDEIAQRMDAFRNNLSIIITMCRDNGVPVVIGTVPSNLFRPLFPKEDADPYKEVLALYQQGQYEEGAKLGRQILARTPRHQSSDLENGVIRALAAAFRVPLADVEQAVIDAEPHKVPGETLFNDHCHLNGEGNKILVQTYEARILALLR